MALINEINRNIHQLLSKFTQDFKGKDAIESIMVIIRIYVWVYIVYNLTTCSFITDPIYKRVVIEFLNSVTVQINCLYLSLFLLGICISYGLCKLLSDLDNKMDDTLSKLKEDVTKRDIEIIKLMFKLEEKNRLIRNLSGQLKKQLISSDEEDEDKDANEDKDVVE